MYTMSPKVQQIFDDLAPNFFNAARGQCNWGHDAEHLRRMLASRTAWWDAITVDEPELVGCDTIIDLGIVFHDLDRSVSMRGRSDEAKATREFFIQNLMSQASSASQTATVIELLRQKPLPAGDPNKSPRARIVDDLDKADMGAVGIYRMAAVACDRGYGIFARARDFDPEAPAIEGDENLDSFAADICFCLEWWTKPKFAIATPAIRRAVEPRFAFMRYFLHQLRREHEELGLID